MVEINNQRKAFLDMLAWSEGLIITDVRKPEIMVMTSLWAEGYLLITPITLANWLALNWLSNQQAPDATSFFPGWLGPTTSNSWKTSLPKSGRCGIAAELRSVATFLERIRRADIRQAIDRCSNIWASLRALVMVSSSIRPDSLIAKIKAGGCGQKIDVWAESPRLSPLWLSASSSACRGAVNHYRDNAITYKASDKNARRELKLANAAITDMQMRQRDVAALDAKYTKELADAKAEDDALPWWCVAAGRRQLHIKAVCRSVAWSHHRLRRGWNATSPRLANTAEQINRLKADHYAKTTGRNRSILMSGE